MSGAPASEIKDIFLISKLSLILSITVLHCNHAMKLISF